MNKKLIPLVVAGTLAIPIVALADSKNVEIYGTLNVDLENVSREDATVGGAGNSLVAAPSATPVNSMARNRVSSNSSNLGFRGTQDLGEGLKAVWQVESALNMDAGGGNLGGRDSYVGLSGGFGTVYYAGATDSPYKRGVQGKDPFFVTGIATQKGILGSPGFNTISIGGVNSGAGTTVGFDARLNNAVYYLTPELSGFSGQIAYSANETKTATADPSVISLSTKYEQGPVFVSLSYETRKDIFGLTGIGPGNTGTSSTDTGTKLGLGYKLLGHTDFLVVLENLSYENSGTVAGVSGYERKAVVASVSHTMGKNRISLSYGKADEGSCTLASGAVCTTDGLGATQIALGYAYSLFKSTALYAHYTQIDNDDKASYFFGVAGAATALPGGVGSDPKGLALGIRQQF